MNTMLNINPWSLFSDLLDADSRAFKSFTARAAGRFPPINVYFSDNAILVDVELPGKTAKDVNLSLEPQAITIAAKPESEGDNARAGSNFRSESMLIRQPPNSQTAFCEFNCPKPQPQASAKSKSKANYKGGRK